MVKSDRRNMLDTYLTYTTSKLVIVRDYKLGLLYYSFVVAIIVYVIWNAVTTGSIFTKSAPIPVSVSASALLNFTGETVPSYCLPGTFNPDGCVYWSSAQMVYPFVGEDNTIFVTTRVSISTAPLQTGCSFRAPTSIACRPPSASVLPKSTYFVANVEKLTFRVDHSIRYLAAGNNNVFASTALSSIAEMDMTGTMVRGCSAGQESLKTFDNTYRSVQLAAINTRLDVFTLPELLSASYCGGTFDFEIGRAHV